jgi:hypothetical protein
MCVKRDFSDWEIQVCLAELCDEKTRDFQFHHEFGECELEKMVRRKRCIFSRHVFW